MGSLVFAVLAFNCWSTMEGSQDFSQFPPLYVCEAAVKQAERDWQAIVAVEDVIVGHSSWRAEEVREAKQAAYRLWDIWWYAAHLRRHGANEWSDGHEDKLRGHLGEAGFEAGVLPLPFGWR